MRRDYQDFAKRDTEVLVVGSEGAESFRRLWQEEDLPFVGLPDPQHQIQNLYGQEVKALKLGRMPAQVLVDKSGTVKYAHYGNSMADIPASTEILGLIDE